MLVVYILSLSVSAALVGTFAHHVLDGMGFLVGFEGRMLVTGGVACAYVATQCGFLSAIRLLHPTRSAALTATEVCSHLSAMILAPHLLGWKVPFPMEGLERLEPLVYTGVFVGLHLFFKLAGFYASLRGESVPYWTAGLWLSVGAIAAATGYAALARWIEVTDMARPGAAGTQGPYRIGDQYSRAQVLSEGAAYEWELREYPRQTLTFRWAALPAESATPGASDRIYVTVALHGDGTKHYVASVRLSASKWAELRVPPEFFPDNVQSGDVRWTRDPEPNWQRMLGLRPVVYVPPHRTVPSESSSAWTVPFSPKLSPGQAPAQVLMSGPLHHQRQAKDAEFSVILIAVEGLSANHASVTGYERETTPAIGRLGYRGMSFRNAFTPAPEAEAAAMTLLTGQTPLQHGFLGDSIGPLSTDTMTLAELLRDRHYATAAFTEGETSAGGDLTYHTGFERGFDLFDPSYAPPIEVFGEDDGEMPASGSQVTLQKARAWIQNHSDVKFFLFLRLRELEEVRHREQYGKAFLEDPENPGPVDVYDNAIAYMDRQIGALIEYVRDRPIKDTTCIVITSLYGHDVDPLGDPPLAVTLDEPSLHVPLIFYVPGLDRRRRGDLVGLEDVAPTIARVARTSFPHPIAGKDFLSGAIHGRPVSMGGEPLTLSIRTPKWRFAWRPGTVPSESSSAWTTLSSGTPLGLFRVSQEPRWWARNRLGASPNVARDLAAEVAKYLQTQKTTAPTQRE